MNIEKIRFICDSPRTKENLSNRRLKISGIIKKGTIKLRGKIWTE